MIAERSLVVVYLANPREKYWGRLDALTGVGVHLRGLDLSMVEEWAREVARAEASGEGAAVMSASSVFFPLARVEKIFLDEASGAALSVRSAFLRIVGRGPEDYLEPRLEPPATAASERGRAGPARPRPKGAVSERSPGVGRAAGASVPRARSRSGRRR